LVCANLKQIDKSEFYAKKGDPGKRIDSLRDPICVICNRFLQDYAK